MKIFLFLLAFSFLWAPVDAASWHQGIVTKAAWYDAGGHQVEINQIRYVFLRTARIKHNGQWHEVADRAYLLTPKTRVRFQKEGFRIYALEIEGR